MGIVYKIVGPTLSPGGKTYIGSATDANVNKWNQHNGKLGTAYNHNGGSQPQLYGYSAYMYTQMEKFGRKNFYMVVLERCADDMLEQHVLRWIKYYQCMWPRGNNTNANIAPNTCELLPKYITYILCTRDNRHGYMVYYTPANKHLHVMITTSEAVTPEILDIAKLYLRTLVDEYSMRMCGNVLPLPMPLPYLSKNKNNKK